MVDNWKNQRVSRHKRESGKKTPEKRTATASPLKMKYSLANSRDRNKSSTEGT